MQKTRYIPAVNVTFKTTWKEKLRTNLSSITKIVIFKMPLNNYLETNVYCGRGCVTRTGPSEKSELSQAPKTQSVVIWSPAAALSSYTGRKTNWKKTEIYEISFNDSNQILFSYHNLMRPMVRGLAIMAASSRQIVSSLADAIGAIFRSDFASGKKRDWK